MSSVASSLLTQTYLALPPPVAAVRPAVRQTQDGDNTQPEGGNGGKGTTAASSVNTTSTGQQATAGGGGQGNRPQIAVGSTLGQTSAGYLTQRLSQETVGTGLHIEPWQTALSSYRSAAGLPASAASNRSSITV